MNKLLLYYLLINNIYGVSGSFYLNTSDLRYLSDIERSFCGITDRCSATVTPNKFALTSTVKQPSTQSTIQMFNGSESKMSSASGPEGSLFPLENYTNVINLPVQPPLRTAVDCCGECLCDVETCDVTDSCCIGTLEELPVQSNSKIRMTCDYPQLKPYQENGYPNAGLSFLMFRKCLNLDTISTETLDKCENSEIYEDIFTKLPVTDVKTMYTYQNRYCSYCHNVSEDNLHYWEAKIECKSGILLPKSINTVVKEVLDTTSCNLNYFRPTSLGMAGPIYKCDVLISKCNVTGLWREYDPLLEAACLLYTTKFNYRYRNVFCYMCNTNDTHGPGTCTRLPSPHVFSDFMALLKVATVEQITDTVSTRRCKYDQIYDPLARLCRDVECLFPKAAENGTCVNIVEKLGGVRFGIYLRLTPYEDINLADSSVVETVLISLNFYFTTWLTAPFQNKGRFSMYIYERHNTTTLLDTVILHHVEHFVVYVEMATFTFKPVSPNIIDYMIAIHGSAIDVENVLENTMKYDVQVNVYDGDIGASQLIDPLLGPFNLIRKYATEVGYYMSELRLIINKLYTCPSIRINSREYTLTRLSHGVHIAEFNIAINNNELLLEETSGGELYAVRICAAMFEELIRPYVKPQSQNKCEDETISTYGILSLVCSIVSIIFSLTTLLIYLRIKDLKTQPGINNILLCTTLVIAQAFFQFGSSQSCNVSKSTCQVIGVFVHFFWLLVIFWMNACCFHMFRVFRYNQTKIAIFNTTKTTMVYVLYSISVSLIPVLINIALSLGASGGQEIGYGGSLCYISDSQMVAYLFALPVGVVILVNIGLYIIVIVQMKNSPKVQNDKNKRDYLKIYAKLSTLTGGTWSFGFLSFFLNLTALDYVFIILNASQGLFLFFAFVVNKRTLGMLLGRKAKETKSISKEQKYTKSQDKVTASTSYL